MISCVTFTCESPVGLLVAYMKHSCFQVIKNPSNLFLLNTTKVLRQNNRRWLCLSSSSSLAVSCTMHENKILKCSVLDCFSFASASIDNQSCTGRIFTLHRAQRGRDKKGRSPIFSQYGPEQAWLITVKFKPNGSYFKRLTIWSETP